MSLSKTFSHLKSLRPLRLLSTATPESAADARRRRKSLLLMPPPLSPAQLRRPPPPPPTKNPDIPKLPETPSALSTLSSPRRHLHNEILTLIRDNDLSEAALLLRHALYSNARPTIFTINAVLSALLRASRYADILSLHRYLITQAAIAPTIATHNILLETYCARGHTDLALDHYRFLLRGSPLSPSPTTYRTLVCGLLHNSRPKDALRIKDDMVSNAFPKPDPIVYHLLMLDFTSRNDPDTALSLFTELKQKLGGEAVMDGTIYSSLVNAHFKKGMEDEAMRCCNEALDDSKVLFNDKSYTSMLEVLSINGQFDYALRLFERMRAEHRPPVRLTLNSGSFKVIVDGLCANGRFGEVIAVFGDMRKMKCGPDTGSYNNLMEHLVENRMVAEVEELYREMCERWIKCDEVTHELLIGACFAASRIDDGIGYFNKMVELELQPTAVAYKKVIGGLVDVGKLDEAWGFFDQMVENGVRWDVTSYEMLLQPFCEHMRLDDALKICKAMLMGEGVVLRPKMEELVKVSLKKEGREEELGVLFEEVAREKAKALARAAEEKARAEALALEEAKQRIADDEERNVTAFRANVDVTKMLPRITEKGKNGPLAIGTNEALVGTPEEAIQDCGDDEIVLDEDVADFDTPRREG